MAKNPNAFTVAQRKQLIALGATMANVREFEAEGAEFETALELQQAEFDTKAAGMSEQARLDAAAKRQADEDAKDNKPNPGKSVYSYPEGDRARSRDGILPHRVSYLGHKITPDVNTAEELELFAQIRPGSYIVRKSDDSRIKVNVVAIRDNANRIEELQIGFGQPNGEAKLNMRPLVDVLRDIIAQSPEPTAVH